MVTEETRPAMLAEVREEPGKKEGGVVGGGEGRGESTLGSCLDGASRVSSLPPVEDPSGLEMGPAPSSAIALFMPGRPKITILFWRAQATAGHTHWTRQKPRQLHPKFEKSHKLEKLRLTGAWVRRLAVVPYSSY